MLALASFAASSPPSIDITARVDRAMITVGDPVRYEITVTHPAGTRIGLPAVRGNTGALEVLGYSVGTDTAPDGRLMVTHALTLAAYAVGADTLPPQRVEIRADGDTAATVLYTQPTYITVQPTVPANARDIADIHDKERLPGSVPWALPIVIVTALGLWVWLRRRARRPAPRPAAAVRALSADEAALARLRELDESGLIAGAAEGWARTFAFALSEILREYLAARYGIEALEATTAELLERTGSLPFAPARHAWLEETAIALDAVKFATGALPPEAATRLLREAGDFVRETVPASGGTAP